MKLLEYVCYMTNLPLLQCLKTCNGKCNIYTRHFVRKMKYGRTKPKYINNKNNKK